MALERQRQANPLSKIEWLSDAQRRANEAIGRATYRVYIDTPPTEEETRAISEEVLSVIHEAWEVALGAATSGAASDAYWVRWAAGLPGAFADWLTLVPPELVRPAIANIRASGVLHDWLRALAVGDAKSPVGLSVEAMGETIAAALDGPTSWLAYCPCGLAYANDNQYSAKTPVCPHCGAARS